jgi:hypothetical protein
VVTQELLFALNAGALRRNGAAQPQFLRDGRIVGGREAARLHSMSEKL